MTARASSFFHEKRVANGRGRGCEMRDPFLAAPPFDQYAHRVIARKELLTALCLIVSSPDDAYHPLFITEFTSSNCIAPRAQMAAPFIKYIVILF
jgi:hypothetical protein